MCGIFAYLDDNCAPDTALSNCAYTIKHRGPDTTVMKRIDNSVFLGFHRLCINDQTDKGNQPMYHPRDPNIVLVCNGEIYNHQKLKEEHSLVTNSGSDCEVILHLYKLFGMRATLLMLDGVFAFVLYDRTKQVLYASRDRMGVRPLFLSVEDTPDSAGDSPKAFVDVSDDVSKDKYKIIALASEVKPLLKFSQKIEPFLPGYLLKYNLRTKERSYKPVLLRSYLCNQSEVAKDSPEFAMICENVYTVLETAVKNA